MKRTGTCPKCGSRDITADTQPVYWLGMHEEQLRVASFANPDALLLKGKTASPLSACVCFACGFTELHATRPEDLRHP